TRCATSDPADSAVPDPGGARLRGVPGQRPAREECSREADRRLRLSVAAVPAFGGSAEGFVSSGAGGVCNAISAAASRESGADGGYACEPHAKGHGPDEP